MNCKTGRYFSIVFSMVGHIWIRDGPQVENHWFTALVGRDFFSLKVHMKSKFTIFLLLPHIASPKVNRGYHVHGLSPFFPCSEAPCTRKTGTTSVLPALAVPTQRLRSLEDHAVIVRCRRVGRFRLGARSPSPFSSSEAEIRCRTHPCPV